MKDYILTDKHGNRTILRIKNNKIYIVKRHLKNWVKYFLCILLSIVTIVLGILIAYIIVK